jgi:7,8-dihydropterin-6-yl-methyl-4-(beta-D-ribofuranosyl)aminobenzene 5'-phosphate synthase
MTKGIWRFVIAACLSAAVFLCAMPVTATSMTSRAEVRELKITILSTMLADKGIGEWGFAALVEVDGHKILFDTGARPRTVLDNAHDLKIDLSDVEDVVVSHFHPDHTGGLLTLRNELMKINPQAMSRVHVGAGIFAPRRGIGTNKFIAVKEQYEATGGKFIVYDKAKEIVPGVWITGPVPRPNVEKNYQDGLEVQIGDAWIADNVPEDSSLVFNTAKGLVLLSGCGHSGVVNTLQYARTFLRAAPVYAAIGGFHLYDAPEEKIAWTAGKFKELGVAQILGAHCTGIETVFRLRELMALTRKTCLVATIGAVFDLGEGIKTGSIAV